MRVGILGGGQLALMLAESGRKLGVECQVYSPEKGAPASRVAQEWQGSFEDEKRLEEFVKGCELVTYEWENLPPLRVQALAKKIPFFYPDPKILETVQDRVQQKRFFNGLGVPTARFFPVEKKEQLQKAVKEIGLPGILKTCRFGYDGKGQKLIQQERDIEGSWEELGSVPLVYEGFVSFSRELSLVACRSRTEEMKFYSLVENLHRGGILRFTLAPAPNLSSELQSRAEGYAKKVFEAFQYTGVLTLELFETKEGLILNEMASRVHNTGHWTIEGAYCSQFENHLRAGMGLALGETHAKGFSAMANFIGKPPDLEKITQVEGASIHLYGKEPRPGRKLGHVTVVAESADALQSKIGLLKKYISFDG